MMNKDEALDAIRESNELLKAVYKLLEKASMVLELENLDQACDLEEAGPNVVNILDYHYEE